MTVFFFPVSCNHGRQCACFDPPLFAICVMEPLTAVRMFRPFFFFLQSVSVQTALMFWHFIHCWDCWDLSTCFFWPQQLVHSLLRNIDSNPRFVFLLWNGDLRCSVEFKVLKFSLFFFSFLASHMNPLSPCKMTTTQQAKPAAAKPQAPPPPRVLEADGRGNRSGGGPGACGPAPR